jgi:hypothetical protein
LQRALAVCTEVLECTHDGIDDWSLSNEEAQRKRNAHKFNPIRGRKLSSLTHEERLLALEIVAAPS